MSYSPAIKIYDSAGAGTPDDITESILGTLEFQLAAMGGCLGASFRLAGGARDEYAYDRGQIVRIWYDSTKDPIYTGRIIERETAIQSSEHIYMVRGLWDELETAADTTAWATDKLVGNDETGDESTAADIIETIYRDALSGSAITWAAGKVAAPRTIHSFLLTARTPIKRAVQQLAYMDSETDRRTVVGVDGAGELYLHPISTDEADRSTIEIGVVADGAALLLATEKPADRPNNEVLVQSERVVSTGNSRGRRANKLFSDATSIGSYGRVRRVQLAVVGVNQEADLSAMATGWLARHADPTPKIEDVWRTGEPPIPWEGQVRYVDSARSLTLDHYVDSVRIQFKSGHCRYQLSLGAPSDSRNDTSDIFAPAPIGTEPRDYDVRDREAWDATDTTTPTTTDVYRLGTEEDFLGTGGGTGTVNLTRGAVISLDMGCPTYDSAIPQGYPCPVTAKIYAGETPLVAVQFRIQRLNSAGGVIAVTSTTGTRIATEDGIETWTDAGGTPYTPSAGDHRIRVGVRVTTASGPPEEYQWYPAEAGSAPDYDSAAVRPVFDPAANTVLLVQALQPVGYPV